MSVTTEPGKGSVMGKHLLAILVLVAILVAGAAAGCAEAKKDTTASLVTEEVEPGVQRIISDGAGHDLEKRHPMYRYDMDSVFVAPARRHRLAGHVVP